MLDAMYLRCPGYGVTGFGVPGWSRTNILAVMSRSLWPLRYRHIKAPDQTGPPFSRVAAGGLTRLRLRGV